jgi:hypothetical protein
MDMRVAGALVGFIFGIMGYIIFRFWLVPIRKYRKLKSEINAEIKYHIKAISGKMWNNKKKKRFQNIRKNILDLCDCYDHDIPVWYKIVLKRRCESPHEAARHLMDLFNVQDGAHVFNRLEKAGTALLLNSNKESKGHD